MQFRLCKMIQSRLSWNILQSVHKKILQSLHKNILQSFHKNILQSLHKNILQKSSQKGCGYPCAPVRLRFDISIKLFAEMMPFILITGRPMVLSIWSTTSPVRTTVQSRAHLLDSEKSEKGNRCSVAIRMSCMRITTTEKAAYVKAIIMERAQRTVSEDHDILILIRFLSFRSCF